MCTCSVGATSFAPTGTPNGVERFSGELRVEVKPASPFRLPLRAGMDGVLRHRGGVLERLLHHEEEPVLVRMTQTAEHRVLFGARASSPAGATYGIARMRFALGVDEDMREFYRRFARDPLIGSSVRRRPWLRVMRRPEPFEALAWAICEQLIEFERAAAIQRRVVTRLGRCWVGKDGNTMRDLPTPAALAGVAPALLESCDLAGARAIALRKAAGEVASGRVDLRGEEHERGWRRLRAIPGIGAWTVEILALRGQGRYDQLPAGDLGLLKLAGRILSGGDPRARACERDVRALFAPYGEWAGLAAVHAAGL
jgi:DNA-3-methyladenine glycosylase II